METHVENLETMDYAEGVDSVQITLDEIIIDFVRDNPCIYNKKHVNFKNVLVKKQIWNKIRDDIEIMYGFVESADDIEKRWSSLRDMYTRQDRRLKLTSSGSGYDPSSEWCLYKHMQFLAPYIAHRRTQSSLKRVMAVASSNQPPTDASAEMSSPNQLAIEPLKIGIGQSMESADHKYCKPKSNEDNVSFIRDDNSTQHSVASSSSSGKYLNNGEFQPIKKKLPEIDQFAKRRENSHDQLEHELASTSAAISNAVGAISKQICAEKNKCGYLTAIEEGLKYVPGEVKTQCFIEILQVIKRYENRS